MNRINLLKGFLEEDPLDSFSKYALALEFDKVGDIHKAILLLTELQQENQTYLPLYYQLGLFQEKNGDKKTAQETYQKGLVIANQAGDNHTANELRSAMEGLNEGVDD